MGVPSFYRWLANKYPNIVVKAVEETGSPKSKENPNGLEFDNLYLDMNGIIHPCFHPDDTEFPPTTFEEVFNLIFEYIDRLFNIVRPRNLLYLAIDGVAPRAKMNQQRARRFRTAKDNEIAEKEEERLRIQFQMEGKDVLPKSESELSDSNVITPGTEFMHRLSKELQCYIRLRINNDPGWKDIKVILSDANVPGEGEHKIMSFIRLQRTFPEYNPNTRHCLYGLDADLIMLALATHELHFSILREDVLVQEPKPSCEAALTFSLYELDSQTNSTKSRGLFPQNVPNHQQKPSSEEANSAPIISGEIKAVNNKLSLIKKPYQFLHVWILREYLELDMEIINPTDKFERDFERIVDDFIFICFFVGNDFLPHMPSLEIHEGAIDLLMHIYKTEFKNLGGYLVDMQRAEDKKGGFMKLKRVEKFMLLIGTYEEKIFKKRSELRERKLRRMLADYARDEHEDDVGSASENVKSATSTELRAISDENHVNRHERIADNNSEILKNTKELKEKLKNSIQKTQDLFKNGDLGPNKVRLGAAGWRERYYKQKFSVDSPEEIESIRKALVEKYTEGLVWVLLYYFSGVPSWNWFYPYYYGLFASDMKGLGNTKVKFQIGLPFKPFDQLLGVLPPRSAHALPLAYRSLMIDERSEIIDFYRTDFEVDVEGKRFSWQGICKLSFIEEERLLAEARKLEKELKEDEAMRNSESVDTLFVRSSSELGSQIQLLHNNQMSTKQSDAMKIDASLSGGMNGFVALKFCISNSDGTVDIQESNVLCVSYEPPPLCQHIPRLLKDVNIPDKTITEADIEETRLWHEYQGNRPHNNYGIHYQERQREDYQSCRPNNSSKIQYQERQRKEINKFYPTNTSPTVIYKPVGLGWGFGRGNVYNSSPPPSLHVHARVDSSSELESRRGIEELKISDSNANSKSYNYGRAQQVHNNLLSSRPSVNHNVWVGRAQQSMVHGNQNYARAQPMTNNAWNERNSSASSNGSSDWRMKVQSNAAQGNPYNGGRGQYASNGGRGQYASPFNSGRGQYTSTSNSGREQCTSTSNSGRGQYASTSNSGRGQYASVWRGQYASASNGGRGQYASNSGRGQYASNSGRGQYASNSGRGQYASDPSAANWNSRNYGSSSGAEWDG